MSRPVLFALVWGGILVLPMQAAFAEAQAAKQDEPAAATATIQESATEPPVEAAEKEAGACLAPDGSDSLPWQPAWLPLRSNACGCKDQCRRDKDCKRVCGPLGGECVMVNSCCTECWCLG